jgi:alkylation response protein AidB-like acyl-CoA dehydrogenase
MSLSAGERDELRSAVRGLLEREASSERVRAAVAEAPGYSRTLWDQMVELGWISMHVPVEYGGGGAGYSELGVVLHELGRAIVPSPFLASAVVASSALTLSDNDQLANESLTSLAAGESLGSAALASADGSYEVSRLTVKWERAGTTIRLQGGSGFVLDADIAGVLVVAGRGADGALALVAVDTKANGVRVERAPTVDATRRLFSVSFDEVVVPDQRLLCEPGARADDLLQQVLAVGVIAAACDATGAAEAVLERATAYAKEREQFGKPIGSFQAVKHHCADMAIAVEASRAATRAACEALDGDPAGWATAAAVTSSYVGPACSNVCATGLQVHGGIGFTWEHDSHLFLKRTKLDEVLFGTPSWHRRRLASAVFPALVAS